MIEFLFRKNFWLMVLVFLLALSYLTAHTATGMARFFIGSAPPVTLQKGPSYDDSNDVPRLRAQFAILNKANLWDPNKKPVTPPPPRRDKAPNKEEKKPAPALGQFCNPMGSYKRSDLPVTLKGTVVASDPAYSVAAIYDARQRKHFVVRQGDNLFGAKICLVERKFVRLDRGRGRLEYLALGAPPGKGRTNYAHRRKLYRYYRNLRKKKLNLGKIRRAGKNHYKIGKGFLQNAMQNLNVIATQAAIVPYFRKGRPAGFRVYHIRKNSIYQKLGIRNGDVIQRINGYEFTSPQKALEAYSNLMSAKNLSVDVLRRGRRMNMSYEIEK